MDIRLCGFGNFTFAVPVAWSAIDNACSVACPDALDHSLEGSWWQEKIKANNIP